MSCPIAEIANEDDCACRVLFFLRTEDLEVLCVVAVRCLLLNGAESVFDGVGTVIETMQVC